MTEGDKILILPPPGEPRRACAYCERATKYTTKHKSDDLIDFCPNCIEPEVGTTYLHIGCIRRLHQNPSGLLHCTNPNCHNLFSEKYNDLSLRKSQEMRNSAAYRLFPVLWLGAGLSSAVFTLLYNECIYRSADIECFIVSIVLEVLSVVLFITAFFSKLSCAGFYLRFAGSKAKADRRLNIEFTVVITCTMFGFFPIATISFIFNKMLGLAIWVFFFHILFLPAVLWRMIRYLKKMKVDVANLNVTLRRISVVDLNSSRARLKDSLTKVV